MGWIVLKAGGSLTDGLDRSYERDVPANATKEDREKVYAEAHAFVDECRKASANYDKSPVGQP